MSQDLDRVCGYLEINGTITKITSLSDVEKWIGNIRNGDDTMIARIDLMNRTNPQQYKEYSSWKDEYGCEYTYNYRLKKGVYGIRAYKIHDGITDIGDNAFELSTELETIYVSDEVTTIGMYSFYKCFNLVEVRLPMSLKLINVGCFSVCTSLREIVIPEGTLFIEKEAFYGCDELRRITLPGSIVCIGEDVFTGCSNLQDIYVPDYAFDKIAQMLPSDLQEKLKGI